MSTPEVVVEAEPAQFGYLSSPRQAFRSFKKSQETQAYWLGATALLPEAAIAHCCDCDLCAEEIAQHYGVSVQLMRFRCNTTGLKVA